MWVYAHNGQKVGPVTFEEIVNQIHSGVIVPNTPVCSSGEKPCRAGHHPKLQPIFASMNKTSENASSGSQEVSTPNVAAGSENQSSAFPQFPLTNSSSKHTSSNHKTTRSRTQKGKNQDQFKLIIIVGVIAFCIVGILSVFLLTNLKSSSTAKSNTELSSSESSDSLSSDIDDDSFSSDFEAHNVKSSSESSDSSRKTSDIHSDVETAREPVQPESPVVLSKKGTTAGEREVITIKGVEFAFRWCPPGTFMMGTPDSELPKPEETYLKAAYAGEDYHQVTLTKGFWMMETEVTQKQWKAVMGYNPSNNKGDDNCPVEDMTWDDCQAFCRKTGLKLPTEAQWEYACRAGTTGPYAGNLDEMGWYWDNCDKNQYQTIHPVGMLKPNAWGLYDMYGNVCEMCQDVCGSYPSGSVTDPTGPAESYDDSYSSRHSQRIVRGGDKYCHKEDCRSASRGSQSVENSSPLRGFRCVIVP